MIAEIVGADVRFLTLDYWDLDNEAVGGPFDIILNLGVLYHLPKPLEAIERALAVTAEHGLMVLDTQLLRRPGPMISLAWEGPLGIRYAADVGVVAFPTKQAVELMLRHTRVADFYEVPLRSNDMPWDFLTERRASWIVRRGVPD